MNLCFSCLNNGFEFLQFLALVISYSFNWIWYLIYTHLTIGEFNWLCVLFILIKIGSKLNSYITSTCIDWSCCTYYTFDGTYEIYTWTLAIVGSWHTPNSLRDLNVSPKQNTTERKGVEARSLVRSTIKG